jgi:hypothetical protein
MSLRDDVARWRRTLTTALLLRALLWGFAVAAASWLLASLVGEREPVRVIALVALSGSAAFAWSLLIRLEGGISSSRAALWIEEQVPALRYALLSAVEHGGSPALERSVRGIEWQRPARRALARWFRQPVIVLAAALAGALLADRFVPARLATDLASPLAPAGLPNALLGIRAQVQPPAYAGLPSSDVEDPTVIRALAGSTIALTAPLPAGVELRELRVQRDSTNVPLDLEAGAWRLSATMSPSPAVIRLSHGTRSRVVVLEPEADSAPLIVVTRPVRDTVLRVARGVIPFEADLSDDFGLISAQWEYVISSGEGERFVFRSGILGSERFSGQRRGQLLALLDLSGLSLGAGDVVHIRATARDANNVSGPGVGYSETRVVRVARAGEYDSVAVEAAPPAEVDKTILSQRMLINLTEALVRRERTLSRPQLTAESRNIARDQARLRRQVSEVVFSRLGDGGAGEHFHGDGHGHEDSELFGKGPLTPAELLEAAEKATQISGEALDFAHDESPVVAINRPLLEAYNAMWDAGRDLDLARPRQALPAMYAALAAIQRARAAERLYLRGTPPRVVIDLARVRLQGKERGTTGRRSARPPIDDARWQALARLDRAIDALSGDAQAAVDSVLLLRMDVIARWPDAGEALRELADAARRGREATAAAIRARRVLAGGGAAADSLGRWGGAPR